MTQEERILFLVELLGKQQKITVEQICQELGISRDSARRDLLRLTKMPGIQRIRGGAVCSSVAIQPLSYRSKDTFTPAKADIARRAAALVSANDFLLLDTGTTISGLASVLEGPLTIISNSLDCAHRLADTEDVEVHILGGRFDPFFRAIVGARAVEQIAYYHVNWAFLGVCGITGKGLSAASEEEAEVKRAMIAQAEKVVVLCEHHKWGQQHKFHVCGLDQIDIVVTDQPASGELVDQLHQHNTEVLLPES